MSTDTALSAGPRQHRHGERVEFARALGAHAVWFPAPEATGQEWPAPLAQRLEVHRCDAMAAMVVQGLSGADLPLLRSLGSRQAFLHDPQRITAGFENGDTAQCLSRTGFKLLMGPGSAAHAPAQLAKGLIGTSEFLLSSPSRLKDYPILNATPLRTDDNGPPSRTARAVALLDLIQDFEVLQPLLARAAALGGPFSLRVAVSDRVRKSATWAGILPFLTVHGIEWFTPIGPLDVVAELGSEKALLLTASESTAGAHQFAHTAARISPARTLRVTLQHGLENVGLQHHRAHDVDFPTGVRFASDVILTWKHPSELADLHPAEAHKCVSVGIIKSLAERAAWLAEGPWHGGLVPDKRRADGEQRQLLIAENLHSVRFKAPARHQRFMAFILAARDLPGWDLTIRSHPASRTLEKQAASNGLRFLSDELKLERLQGFDRFVSPPSTVLLDAVLAGVPAAVWADAPVVGDATHYSGLPVVTDITDLDLTPAVQAEGGQLQWAVQASAALNGAPAAWNTLVRLFD
jgi:hypothetical protein